MNKKLKATLYTFALVVAGYGSVKAYDAYQVSNMSDSDLLLLENISAISESKPGKSGQTVRVRAAYEDPCWRPKYTSCECTDPQHKKDGWNCYFSHVQWTKDHDMFRCFNMPVERYLEEGTWTAAYPEDEICAYLQASSKPAASDNHIIRSFN
ncbi:MAG: hypothetical protein J5805_02070 [Bacteroidaceae bacterium]|nr:hypothetical protein [Bacteroidaceae bacterium]